MKTGRETTARDMCSHHIVKLFVLSRHQLGKWRIRNDVCGNININADTCILGCGARHRIAHTNNNFKNKTNKYQR